MIGAGPLGLVVVAFNLFALAAAPAVAPASHRHCSAGCTIAGSPSPGAVNNQLSGVVSISPVNAWAVGSASTPVGNPAILVSSPLVAHWDGAAWKAVQTPALVDGGALAGITAISPRNMWAVGHQGPADAGSPLIEHWNGHTWAVVPSPIVAQGFLLGTSALRADDIWSVGVQLGSTSFSLVEHWNGRAWSVMNSPNPSADYNELDSVVAISPNLAWAVGQTFSPSTGSSQALILRWNGSSWNAVPAPSTSMPNSVLHGVAARSIHDVWAVGLSRSDDGSAIQPLVERWTGDGWKVVAVPSPTPQSWLTGIAIVKGEVWTAGVQVVGFTNRTLLERGSDGRFSVVPSKNAGAGDNRLEGIGVAAGGPIWAVGSDQGLTKGMSLVLRICG